MLNPRKVFTHCKLVTRLTGYQRRPLCFSHGRGGGGRSLCIEKRQEPQHAILLTHIAEKDFTYSEQMDLSPGREGAAELLTSQVCPRGDGDEDRGQQADLQGAVPREPAVPGGGRQLLLRLRRAALLPDHGGGGGRRRER